jgi:hypothetical protein
MSLTLESPDYIAHAARYRGTSARPPLVALAVLLQTMLCIPTAFAQNFGEWRSPVSVDPDRTIGINTPFNDGCPIESPDGHTLYLATDRFANQLDIWTASRAVGNGWHIEPLAFPINTPAAEFCPTPLPGRQLLFVSTRANNCGGTGPNPDIYYTRQDHEGNWLEPQPLSCNVNSGGTEFSPSLVEAEGETMLFFSSGTPQSQKIYVSFLEPDGTWRAAEEVIELNLLGSNARPNVRKDGLEIVWDSTRDGGPPQIYTATRSNVFEPWSNVTRLTTCPLDCVNDPTEAQTRASLSRDGRRLYFGSTRANKTLGGVQSDIYVATRLGPGRRNQEHERAGCPRKRCVK